VTIFEALHDMPRPVDALRAVHAMLAEGGSVVVADELVADEFTAPGPNRDRYAYGWSVVSCLPSVMGDPQTTATVSMWGPGVPGLPDPHSDGRARMRGAGTLPGVLTRISD